MEKETQGHEDPEESAEWEREKQWLTGDVGTEPPRQAEENEIETEQWEQTGQAHEWREVTRQWEQDKKHEDPPSPTWLQ